MDKTLDWAAKELEGFMRNWRAQRHPSRHAA